MKSTFWTKLEKIWPKIKYVSQIIAYIVAAIIIYLLLSPIIAARYAKSFKKDVKIKGKFKVKKVKTKSDVPMDSLEKAIDAGTRILNKIKPK